VEAGIARESAKHTREEVKMNWRAYLMVMMLGILVGMPTLAQKKSEERPIKTTVAAILEEPDRFDKKLVQVEGKVSDYKEKTSRAGNTYTTFKLEQGEKKITVFSYGHLRLQNGDEVVVIGRFYKEKRVGRAIFKNEIDASTREGGKITKKE
jgi:imidazoleglycerol phosphate synthase glutamine amidotransferase subunit HisH